MQLKTFLSKLKERKKSNLITNASDVGLLKSDCQTSMKVLTLLHIVTLCFCFLYYLNAQTLFVFKNWMAIIYTATIAMLIICDRKIKKKDFLYLAMLTLFGLLSVFFNNGGIGSVASLIFPLLFLCVVENCNINRSLVFILKSTSIFVLCAFTVVAVLLFNDYNSYIVSFIDVNPNTIAMMTLMSFMLWYILEDFDDKSNKIFFMLLIFVVFYIICKTKGRTSLLGFVVVSLLIVCPKRIAKKLLFKKCIELIIIVLGLIVPLVYLSMDMMEVNLVLWDKSLYTGREEVWRNLFTQLSDGGVLNWLFGVGSDAEILGNSFDAHNSYFSVIGCFGVVGFLLYGLFFMKKIELLYNFTNDAVVRKSIIALYAILILSYFEAINLISLGMFTFFIPIGLGLSRARELNSKKNMCADISIVSL